MSSREEEEEVVKVQGGGLEEWGGAEMKGRGEEGEGMSGGWEEQDAENKILQLLLILILDLIWNHSTIDKYIFYIDEIYVHSNHNLHLYLHTYIYAYTAIFWSYNIYQQNLQF